MNSKAVKRTCILALGVLGLFVATQSAIALSPSGGKLCTGHFTNPITDVDWKGLFPITIGDIHVVSGGPPDTPNPSSPVCLCPLPIGWRIGMTVGYWEPFALTDVTRQPFCMVDLGGIELPLSNSIPQGEVHNAEGEDDDAFYYVHWYKFPLMYWLNILTDLACLEHGGFDIAYLTEIDPTWSNDQLAFILNPEAILFSSIPAQMACAADAIAASTHLPLDSLFWCAGANGSMYPLTGNVQEDYGGVVTSVLLTERMDFKMHREGLVWDTVGENSPEVCHQYPDPILPMSRYRYQMVNPVATTDTVEPFGHTTITWSAFKQFPKNGQNFGYLIWRKRNCCMM